MRWGLRGVGLRQSLRRIIETERAVVVGDVCRHNGTVDLSDLLELEVKVIRRDGVIDPLKNTLLKRLWRKIAQGSLKPAQFRANAGVILAMPPALPKKIRMAEASYLQK